MSERTGIESHSTKPRITGKFYECMSNESIYIMWYCALPGTKEIRITGVGLTPREAWGEWRDRFCTGVQFAAFGIRNPGV